MQFVYDPHIHTSVGSRCGRRLPEDIVRLFHKLGYTGIFITDHFFNNVSTTVPYKDIPWVWTYSSALRIRIRETIS